MTCKIVVIGGVEGALSSVFTKLSNLHAKNAFSFAIVVGDLFADPAASGAADDEMVQSLLRGEIKVPLPTYFTLNRYPLPQPVVEKVETSSGELTANLRFLGKRTTLKTSEGVKLVVLGGSLESGATGSSSKDHYLPYYSESDARALFGANSADILITSQWPSQIRVNSEVAMSLEYGEPPSHQCIAELCATLKPRYHFSTSPNLFWEREPFFHMPRDDSVDSKPVTRFISLASFNNAAKQKWLYAFSLDPKAAPPLSLPPGTTASPLQSKSQKRSRFPDQGDSYSRFAHGDHYRPSKRARPPPTPSECFFCLSNTNLATHLITSIGTDSYLTIAKGPLSTSQTFPALGFPAHILIIPLTHTATLSLISEPESRRSTFEEMQKYRKALQNMLKQKSKSGLGAVTWEVSRASGVHIHWQFLPCPSDLIEKGLVEAAFKVEAENEKYMWFKDRDIGDGSAEKGDYFRVWIWRGGDDDVDGSTETEKSLVLPLSAKTRFDIQFGRRVMAKLLRLEGRISWRDCSQTEAEEIADAEAFQQLFKQFDFSIAEG